MVYLKRVITVPKKAKDIQTCSRACQTKNAFLVAPSQELSAAFSLVTSLPLSDIGVVSQTNVRRTVPS